MFWSVTATPSRLDDQQRPDRELIKLHADRVTVAHFPNVLAHEYSDVSGSPAVRHTCVKRVCAACYSERSSLPPGFP